MKGQLRLVVDRLATDVWEPLSAHVDAPDELLGEIYRSLVTHLSAYQATDSERAARAPIAVAEALESSDDALRYLLEIGADDFRAEHDAIAGLASTLDAVAEFDLPSLNARYVGLLRDFVEKYSLRYYVDDGGRMWLSFPGLAASLFAELRRVAIANAVLAPLMSDFEYALAECTADPREDRIKTVIQKQMNLLEALGMGHAHVAGTTLGRICDEIGTWPHEKVMEATKALYGFASDYPGIRHAGSFATAIRSLDLRDLSGLTLAMVGLSTYLTDGLDANAAASLDGGAGVARSAAAPWGVGPSGLLTTGS